MVWQQVNAVAYSPLWIKQGSVHSAAHVDNQGTNASCVLGGWLTPDHTMAGRITQ